MKIVRIPRQTLLMHLRRNRARHMESYETALRGYWMKYYALLVKARDDLTKIIKTVRNHNEPDLSKLRFSLPKPVSHEKDYTRVIGMLEMSSDINIEVTEEEFMRYVKDQWQWRDEFVSNSTMYAKAAVAMVKKRRK